MPEYEVRFEWQGPRPSVTASRLKKNKSVKHTDKNHGEGGLMIILATYTMLSVILDRDAAIRAPVLRVEASLGYLRRFKLRQRSRGHWNVEYGRTARDKGERRRGERPGQRYRPSSVPCSQKLTGSGADVMGFDMPQVQAITGISPSSSRFMCSLLSTQPHFQPEQPRSAAAMMWCLQVIIYLACTTTPCRRPWPKAFHIG